MPDILIVIINLRDLYNYRVHACDEWIQYNIDVDEICKAGGMRVKDRVET